MALGTFIKCLEEKLGNFINDWFRLLAESELIFDQFILDYILEFNTNMSKSAHQGPRFF